MIWFTNTGELFFQFSYGSVSFILYFLTIIAISKNPQLFGDSFYLMYKINFVINILAYFNSMIGFRLPNSTCDECLLAPFYRNDSAELTSSYSNRLFFYNQYSMALLQFASIFLISLNRLGSAVRFTTYDIFWRKYCLILYGVAVFISFICPVTLLLSPAFYYYVSPNFLLVSTADTGFIANLSLIGMVLLTFLTVCVNLFTFLCWPYYLPEKNYQRNVLPLVVFLAQIFLFINLVIIREVKYFSLETVELARWALPYTSDFFTFIQPWILILSSTLIRFSITDLFYPVVTGNARRGSAGSNETAGNDVGSVQLQEFPKPATTVFATDESRNMEHKPTTSKQSEQVEQPEKPEQSAEQPESSNQVQQQSVQTESSK